MAASVTIGIACVATISTDAFAYRGGRVGAWAFITAALIAVFTVAQPYAVASR